LPAGCNPDAPRNVLYTITEIYPDHLVLDGNHPLSGIALRISLKVNHVRLATDQEQEAGTCGTGFFKIEIGDTPGSAGGLLH
jgi:FKBP-type peptidyl-prolyl cis-trans isomerase SlyD